MNKKYLLKDILFFIFLIIIACSSILPKAVNNLDELWNFNFARNFANDKLPYKDFNMVQTPLLSFVAGMILKVFGTELLVMRILAIILSISIFFIIYKILMNLKISRKIIYVFLLALMLLCKNYLCIDYNFAVLFIILLTTFLELKYIEKNSFKKDFFIGLLVRNIDFNKTNNGNFF
ncbi:MAG: hypothetical protein E7310_05950 [Clostridiales bacterium]|nr:hypothetical protein [Clostridiales bacterium]